ncbi:putative protease inhibitor [Coniochaeta ligniaria NRRL 30616]|uniref:Putative protease inhibitor n=1 Tax=Coniochaeta ligniaria NRRL 30616 TaxID=1408157 RepID=A0A1J7IHA0_9PEZI|nr:putative protease inhibitor [Coniochaeta ligniaria NRRL 30616]
MRVDKSVEAGLALIAKDKSRILGLSHGNHTNIQPGDFVPKGDATSPPKLTYAAASPSATYLVICLDLDGPFPNFSVCSPALHWLQPGLKSTGTDTELLSKDPFVCDYAPPGPPPIGSPHRYVYFLYEQPDGFDGSKYAPPGGKGVGIGPRMRWSLDDWGKGVGLGPVLAVNYHSSQ